MDNQFPKKVYKASAVECQVWGEIAWKVKRLKIVPGGEYQTQRRLEQGSCIWLLLVLPMAGTVAARMVQTN